LAKRISKGSKRASSSVDADHAKLVRQLDESQIESAEFAKFGFTARLDHEGLREALRVADGKERNMLIEVLSPYVESLTARFKALRDLADSVQQWVGAMNGFFKNKQVVFDLGDGLKIYSVSGRLLTIAQLSSGERHLLLLMARSYAMRAAGGYLIIDEPELSLNVKWQRKLISSLLGSLGRDSGQLILASHSLDIAGIDLANVSSLE
jgi:predicted ATP-dependent endonuclease of OLD family